MIRNYLLATLRILAKEKLYTIINSVGLAIGLATCFLIYSWVRFETSYDASFQDSERIYRIVTKWDGSAEQGIASTYPMVRTRVLSQFPEVEESARLFNQGFLGSKTRIAYQDKVFTDNLFFYGDSTILKIFSFKIVKGNEATALHKPSAVILTKKSAEKFFGFEDPIGKTIVVGTNREFEVTGVIENIPPNAHFHFDLLASMQSHPWIKGAENNVWSGVVFHTYVKLKKGASPAELEKKIANLLDHFPDDPQQNGKNLDLRLQPLRDIHLKSDMKFELEPNGNITYVYLFVTIAALILVVAMINYTNLATARHTQRFKEVGVRKVLGASRKQLITQFMMESLVIALLAFILAVFLVEIARPLLLSLSGQEYWSASLIQPQILLTVVAITLFIGLLTGLSPALALSAFKPVKLFKANVSSFSKGITARKILIISQFTVSIALTICTAVTYKQVKYLQEAKLGYDLDHTIVLNIGFKNIHDKVAILKSQLMNNTSILGTTATSQLPTDIETGENIDITKSQSIGVNCVSVDPDFFKVMGIKVRLGEQLISSIQVSDSLNHFVINESALKSIGWKEEDAINKLISIRHGNQQPGPVVGVVSDFHFQSLHHAMGPLVLEFNPGGYQYLLIKVKRENLSETISFISKKWEEIAGGIPFDYMFLDHEYDNLYKSEQQRGTLFIAFSSIAVLISLLGLFGLSSFAAERRTKEIGLRKILGADMSNIFLLVSKDFLLLLVISFVLALPVGYYYMNTWLSHFAFKTNIGPGLFLLAGSINFLLALFTLSFHSLKISGTNPVETLRYE